MTWWRILVARGRALMRPQQVRDEIDEELQFHLEMRAKANSRHGMSDAEARQAAKRAFGSVTSIKEVSYDIRGGGWIEAIGRDLAYASRALLAQRGLSLAIASIVAIGVGTSAAIVSVADRVLWRELPVRAPAELEQFTLKSQFSAVSYPLYQALRRENDVFAGVFARSRQTSTFVAGGDPERRVVELVSGDYFDILGVRPSVGRLFSERDDRTIMSHPVAVVSDRYWRTRLGAADSAIGRTVLIDDYPFTVVGVAPPGFFGVEVGLEPAAWVPLAMHPVLFAAHRSLVDDSWMWLEVIGRRAPGVTPARAEAWATLALRRFHEVSGEHITGLTPRDIKLHPVNRGLSPLRDDLRLPLAVLIGIVAFVLLVACANVATLVVARSMARAREIAVRLALGASRARLVRQLLAENLILALAGGIVGTVLAIGAARALVQLLPPAIVPRAIDVTPDARMLAIALGLSTITGLLFSVAPALRATRLDVVRVIRDDARVHTAGRWDLALRRALVVGQVAVALVLVTGAGLFAKSLARLSAVPTGFNADHVLLATISPSMNRYTNESALAFYRALQARLSAAPGVTAVGTSAVPLFGGQDVYNIITLRVPGQRRPSDPFSLLTHSVGGDFFGATGVQLRSGRGLDARDVGGGPTSVVLNETAARVYFGDQDPVGKPALLMGRPATVVGVARDSKYRTMREAMPQIVYLTFDQDADIPGLERTIYVRTSGDPSSFALLLESAVHDLDASLPVYDVRTLGEQQRRAMASERVVAGLSALSAGIALLLAAIGLYGLVRFDTQRRTRELGVRISLGATPSRVMLLVLRGMTGMLIIGTVAGLAISRGLSSLAKAQLYGVSASDASIFTAACAILTVAVFIAASVPAWRASHINPVEALRCE